MPDFEQNYNVNNLYICLILLIYNIWKNNYEYINIIFKKIYLFNYTSLVIMLNLIGLYLLLKKLSIDISIKCSIKYK